MSLRNGVCIHASTYTCVCVCIYMHRPPIYNFSAFYTSVTDLSSAVPKRTSKAGKATNLSFSCLLLSPLSLSGDETENNARLRSCCFAIKKHKLLDLGVGIQNSFLCTLYNVIIVLLLAQHDSCKTTLFSVDSNM